MSSAPAEPGPSLDRNPPQDIDAEKSVLGAMLSSKDAIADVVEELKGVDFYRPGHELIFNTITDLYGRGDPADTVTTADELDRRGELERAGGRLYLAELLSNVTVTANAAYYAKIVADKAVLRRLVEASIRIAQMGYQGQGEVADIVDAAQQDQRGRSPALGALREHLRRAGGHRGPWRRHGRHPHRIHRPR